MTKAYSVTIPAVVNGNPNLSNRQKLLYGRIFALANKEGYCFALNQFFAKEFGVHKNTINKDMAVLKQQGLIKTAVVRDETKQITSRKIFPTLYPPADIPISPRGLESIKKENKNKKKTEKNTPVTSDAKLPLDPIYPKGFPFYLDIPSDQLPTKETVKDTFDKWAKAVAKGNSKTSLSPCTIDELLFLCKKHGLYYPEVLTKYRDIIELINDGTFQKKYKHNKTIYRTLDKWLSMDLQRGYLDPITEAGQMKALFDKPKGWLLPHNFKYRKMYQDLRERKGI